MADSKAVNHRGCTVALLPWGNVFEDYLDGIGLSIDDFCTKMTGGWLFGYVDALQLAGVRSVIFCVSSRVWKPERRVHRDTGAAICLLPASASYRAVRRLMKNPYGWDLEHTFHRIPRFVRAPLTAVRAVAPYLATPLRLLAREMERERCSLLLCQEYEYARFDACVLLGRRMGLPVFATFQGGDRPSSRLEAAIRPRTMRACTGLIVPTRSEAKRIGLAYDLSPEKIGLVPNPINLTDWGQIDRAAARASLGLDDDLSIAICHSRIEMHRKGIDTLLEAWRHVVHEQPKRKLLLILIGSGIEADALRQYLREAPVPRLQWHETYMTDRNAIHRYLCAADVYVSASRHEGFPVAPLEAMACGLPIVATDAQGVPDILEQGEASGGFLVPRDDIARFASALSQVLDNGRLARRLGDAARRSVEARFSLQAVGAQLHDFLIQRMAAAD